MYTVTRKNVVNNEYPSERGKADGMPWLFSSVRHERATIFPPQLHISMLNLFFTFRFLFNNRLMNNVLGC